jgi:hypothetical protein
MSIAKRATALEPKSGLEQIVQTFLHSVHNAKHFDKPYRNWWLINCFPGDTIDDVLALPFQAPSLHGISGKRELHNDTRKYFDVENRKRYAVCEAVSEALQDKRVTSRIEKVFGTDLKGTFLRIELAQDIEGFWLEPHTDLGVKVFTMLLYLSKDPSHYNLGTDIYDAEKSHVGRSPFISNGAMVFVPSTDTNHGFEKRPINGIRTSLIINYVTNGWRAREQLSFPDRPIA